VPSAKKAAKPAPKKRQATAKPLTPWQKWSANPEKAMLSLCEEIAGGQHLNGYCAEHELRYATLRGWIGADPGRASMYAQAREDRADKIADEIVAISDEVEVATKYEGEEVRLAMDAAAVARNRLRVDARKWVASKLKPRVYGEKLDVTQELTVKNLTDEQMQAEIARLEARIHAVTGSAAA
jgi:hypothetical protein